MLFIKPVRVFLYICAMLLVLMPATHKQAYAKERWKTRQAKYELLEKSDDNN